MALSEHLINWMRALCLLVYSLSCLLDGELLVDPSCKSDSSLKPQNSYPDLQSRHEKVFVGWMNEIVHYMFAYYSLVPPFPPSSLVLPLQMRKRGLKSSTNLGFLYWCIKYDSIGLGIRRPSLVMSPACSMFDPWFTPWIPVSLSFQWSGALKAL